MESRQIQLHYNPMRQGLGQVLGPLESEIMWLVWQQGQATVKQIHRVLSRRREIAYTTVMTTMSRLADKGIMRRARRGMAYIYRPTMTKPEFDQWVLRSVITGLLENFNGSTMEYLVEYLSQEHPEQLEHLRQALAGRAA